MAKALVTVKGIDLDDTVVRLIYEVVLLGPPHQRFGQDFILNTQNSLATNLSQLKDKIAAHIVSTGQKISTGDVIIFGAPVVKDTLSLTDSTKGITSDNTAVELQPAVKVADAGFLERMWNWMVG